MNRSLVIYLLMLALIPRPAKPQTPLPPPPITIPAGATAITGNGGAATGPVAGMLSGVAGTTTFFCAFQVIATGGTINLVTVTGLGGPSGPSTLSQSFAGAGLNQQQQLITPCLPATAPNSPITTTVIVDGTPTAVNVNSWGYTQ